MLMYHSQSSLERCGFKTNPSSSSWSLEPLSLSLASSSASSGSWSSSPTETKTTKTPPPFRPAPLRLSINHLLHPLLHQAVDQLVDQARVDKLAVDQLADQARVDQLVVDRVVGRVVGQDQQAQVELRPVIRWRLHLLLIC